MFLTTIHRKMQNLLGTLATLEMRFQNRQVFLLTMLFLLKWYISLHAVLFLSFLLV